MTKSDVMLAFYISIICGGAGLGFGFADIFSFGVGWLVFGLYAIASIPVGFWVNINIDKFLRN